LAVGPPAPQSVAANDKVVLGFMGVGGRGRALLQGFGKRPIAEVEQVHLSTLLCHYGDIAYRVGRKLVIDPATEGFVGDAQANALVKRTCRQPYAVPEIA
jgi:GFO/IDH/MocA oxidoreductase family protein